MSWKPRTIGLVILGAAVILGLGYVAFRPDPIPVDLHSVARGPMEVTINADGVTRIKDIYDVASPIMGTAQRSPVIVGDRVIAGETLVASVQPTTPGLLDSRSLFQAEASAQEARSAVFVAETEHAKTLDDLALAQSQFERTQTLVERDVASFTQLEDAVQRLAVAEAAVEAAAARIDMAQSSLARAESMLEMPEPGPEGDDSCCMQITAPSSGVVLSVASESARPVVTGAPLLSIGDPTNLEIVADLLSSDAVRIAPGAMARVERWGGDVILGATLNRIAPAAQTKTSALGIEEQRVDAYFDIGSPLTEREALGDGFAVFLRIIEWQSDDALQVPLSAVFKRDENWTVFVAQDGIAAAQTLTLGQRNSQFAEVLDGLSEGDLVVTHPNDDLSEGQQIVQRSAMEN